MKDIASHLLQNIFFITIRLYATFSCALLDILLNNLSNYFDFNIE